MSGMRSFLAGVALFLAFLSGTMALAAFVTYDDLLDPARAGQVVANSLKQDALRDKVLARVVPGYDLLPPSVQAGIGAVATSSGAQDAVSQLRLQDNGTIDLAPLQAELASSLRASGHPLLATAVSADRGSASVSVPATYLDKYTTAREVSRKLWIGGGLIALGLVAIAVLVSKHRRRTIRSTGLATLLACAAVALGYWVMPTFVQAASSAAESDAVAAVLQAQRPTVLHTLLPVAVVGVVLVVVGLAGGRRRS